MPAQAAITIHSHKTLDADPFHLEDEAGILVNSVRRTVNSGISERRVDLRGRCFLRVEADQRMEFDVSAAVLVVGGLNDYHPGRSLGSTGLAFAFGSEQFAHDEGHHLFKDDGIFIYESATDTDGQGVLRNVDIAISYDLHTGLDETIVPDNDIENPGGEVGVEATGYATVPDQTPVDITDDAKNAALEEAFTRSGALTGTLQLHIYDNTTLLDTHEFTAGQFWSAYEDAASGEGATAAVARAASTGENHTLPVADSSSVGGVPVYTGDVILLKDQTDPAENGIYTVGGGRDSSFDEWANFTYVICDVTASGKTYRTRNGAGTLETTAIAWEDTDFIANLSPNAEILLPATASSRTITKIVIERATTPALEIATVTLASSLTVAANKVVKIPVTAIRLSMRWPYPGTLTLAADWDDAGGVIQYTPPAAVWGGYILGGDENTHMANNECVDVTGYTLGDSNQLVPYATARIPRTSGNWIVSGNTVTQDGIFEIPGGGIETTEETDIVCVFVTPCNGGGLILHKQDISLPAFTASDLVALPDAMLTLDLDA